MEAGGSVAMDRKKGELRKVAFDRAARTRTCRTPRRCRTHLNNCFSFSYLTPPSPSPPPRVPIEMHAHASVRVCMYTHRGTARRVTTANNPGRRKFVIENRSRAEKFDGTITFLRFRRSRECRSVSRVPPVR